MTSYKQDCMHYCNKYGCLKEKLKHKLIIVPRFNQWSVNYQLHHRNGCFLVILICRIAVKTSCQIFFVAQFNRTTHVIYTVRCIKICVDFTQITCGARTSDIVFYTGSISWDVLDHLLDNLFLSKQKKQYGSSSILKAYTSFHQQ